MSKIPQMNLIFKFTFSATFHLNITWRTLHYMPCESHGVLGSSDLLGVSAHWFPSGSFCFTWAKSRTLDIRECRRTWGCIPTCTEDHWDNTCHQLSSPVAYNVILATVCDAEGVPWGQHTGLQTTYYYTGKVCWACMVFFKNTLFYIHVGCSSPLSGIFFSATMCCWH